MTVKKSAAPTNDPLFIAVGERITALRELHELTSHQLAAVADMDVNYLWRIEAGRQNLSLRNVARLAKAFGLTLSDLLKGVDVGEIELDRRAYVKRNEDNRGEV